MAWDFKFDPVKRDLIRNSRGSVEVTHTAETMAMHQIAIHYRTWPGGPEIGSRLHDLKAFARNPEIAVPAEMQRALGVIVQRGRIDNLNVIGEAPRQGRVNVAGEFRDVRTGVVVKTGA